MTLLRFGQPTADHHTRPAARDRLRLWLLFAVACVVLFGIRMLREPETARRIDNLFVADEPLEKPAVTIAEALGKDGGNVELGPVSLPEPVVSETQQANESSAKNTQFDLSSVRDNTYFRPEENAAWFAVFDWLMALEPAELASRSTGEVSYAQFIDQPEVYRGLIVTVKGTVERQELLDAPPNDVGIKQYHRLIVRPRGGGVWPIVVYCLELPPNFPRGEDKNAEVTVHGIFFKNWSYSWQDGLGLAPVVLAKSIELHPVISTKRQQTEVSLPALAGVTVAAAIIATFVGWFAWRHTRRPTYVLTRRREVIAPPPEVR